MNIIWSILMLLSLVVLTIISPASILNTMTNSVLGTLEVCLSLFCIYTVWLGFIEVMDKSNLLAKLSKFLTPFINKIFGKVDSSAAKDISTNLTANFLGASNASTPAALKAIDKLRRSNNTYAIIMLFVLNCCSLQFLPTTIMGILSKNGSSNASGIILPIIIVSIICFLLAVILTTLIYGREKIKWFIFFHHFLSLSFLMHL